jgi:hypothetical protein
MTVSTTRLEDLAAGSRRDVLSGLFSAEGAAEALTAVLNFGQPLPLRLKELRMKRDGDGHWRSPMQQGLVRSVGEQVLTVFHSLVSMLSMR